MNVLTGETKLGRLLTVREAMARLGVSRAALYYAMAEGRLKYVERYGKRLVTERALASYVPRQYGARRQGCTKIIG